MMTAPARTSDNSSVSIPTSIINQPLDLGDQVENPELKPITDFFELAKFFPRLVVVSSDTRRDCLHRMNGKIVHGRKVELPDIDFTFPDEEMGRVSER